MLLSVVVSFKNEDENLSELIRRVAESLKGHCSHEIVFVNDASTDRSLEILRAHLPLGNIRIINTSRSFGHGPCLYAGLRHTKGDAIVYIDADLQDPPEMIPQLISEYSKGYDVVMTRRKAREGETWLKIFVTKIAYKFLRRAAPNIFIENAGDFRLISRRVVDQLLSMTEADAIYRGLVSWVGFKTATIEYVRSPRYRGVSHHSFLTGVPTRYFFNALVSFSNVPIYLLLIIGFFLTLFSLVLGTVAIVRGEGASSLLPIMMTIQLVLTSILFGALGVLGLYLMRIYQQVRGRPDYIIESVEGFE